MENRIRFNEQEAYYIGEFDVDSFVDHYNTDHSFIDELSVFDGL